MTKIKDLISIFRDGLLLCLFILLILFPRSFNAILENAGFTQGSLMGFTWQEKAKQVAESSQQLATNASQQIDKMQESLDSISKKLISLPATANTREVHEIAQSINVSKERFNLYNKELKRNVQSQNKKIDSVFNKHN